MRDYLAYKIDNRSTYIKKNKQEEQKCDFV